MVENFDILNIEGFFLLNTLLKVTEQYINSFVYLALMIIDPEVVTREFLSLLDLSRAQTLHVHEAMEVVMIDEY